MARYKTTDIKIEGTAKHLHRNMLNTIAHRKIKGIEGLIPFENGKYVSRLESTLQGGYIVSYKSGNLWIARFLYRTKELVEDNKNGRWMYISYEEFLQFQREMTINEALGIETKLISHYAKRKPRPKLEKPFEVKVGEILRCGKFSKIIVTKVTPRTFTYNYIDVDTMEIDEFWGDMIARIKDHGNGPAWIAESDNVLNKGDN